MKGYCKACKQNVEGVNPKSGSWIGILFIMILVFLISGIAGILIIGIFSGVAYMIASCFAPKNMCPICGMKIK